MILLLFLGCALGVHRESRDTVGGKRKRSGKSLTKTEIWWMVYFV
jgi:hypothetical protein